MYKVLQVKKEYQNLIAGLSILSPPTKKVVYALAGTSFEPRPFPSMGVASVRVWAKFFLLQRISAVTALSTTECASLISQTATN